MDLSTYSYRYVYICCLYFDAFSFRFFFLFFNRFPYFLLFIFGLLKINISVIVFHVLTVFKSIFILPSISNFLLFCFAQQENFPKIPCFPLHGQIIAISKESSKTLLLRMLSLPFVVDSSEQLYLMGKVGKTEVKKV